MHSTLRPSLTRTSNSPFQFLSLRFFPRAFPAGATHGRLRRRTQQCCEMLIRRPHETDAAVRDQIAFVKSLDICIIAFGSWNEALVATGPRKTSALIADQAPLRFPDDIVAWSTWPYCGEAETQRRAAKRLGVARATVANYLSNARKRGLLESKVVANILKDGKLSSAVCEKYGLQHDYVIPRTDRHYVKPDRLRQRAGEIGARFLKAMLREGDKPEVACGRSMLNVADPLPRGRVAGVTVTQIAGSMLNDERSSSEFRTAMIAFRLGAKSLNIHAPAVMSSKETRDRLMREPSLALYGERLEFVRDHGLRRWAIRRGCKTWRHKPRRRSDSCPPQKAGRSGHSGRPLHRRQGPRSHRAADRPPDRNGIGRLQACA